MWLIITLSLYCVAPSCGSTVFTPNPALGVRPDDHHARPRGLHRSRIDKRGDGLDAFALRKLATAETWSHPFPHLVAAKFLPTAMAKALADTWPHRLMQPMPTERTGNPQALKARRLYRLDQQGLRALPAGDQQVWQCFHDLITRLAPAMLESLPPPPRGQKMASAEGVRLAPRIDLWSDFTDYGVRPHTEAPHKFANFLLYISPDPSLTGEGTSIYVPRDTSLRSWEGSMMPREYFRCTGTVPYRANLLFGFRKTDLSFHGKERVELKKAATPRLTIGISIQPIDGFVR